jgi:hypothetical protein
VFLLTDAKKRMAEVGLAVPQPRPKKLQGHGKEFDPAKPEEYLNSFKIRKVVCMTCNTRLAGPLLSLLILRAVRRRVVHRDGDHQARAAVAGGRSRIRRADGQAAPSGQSAMPGPGEVAAKPSGNT